MPIPAESPPPLVFDRLLFRRPAVTVGLLLLLFALLGYHAFDFRLDASSETLMLEHDADLAYAREIRSRYGESDYLVVALAPRGDLLDDAVLDRLAALRDDLQRVSGVSEVLTILDMPLLESPPVSFKELAGQRRTLRSPGTDRRLARRELEHSPLYRNLLVSPDLKMTALVVNFPPDERWRALRAERDALRDKAAAGGLDPAERLRYDAVVAAFQDYRERKRHQWHRVIEAVRAVLHRHQDAGALYLGGADMIADDMLRFIRSDLEVFGSAVLTILVAVLYLLFRGWRWVVLPILCCAFSALSMIGLLGLLGWEVTVISSNFISLQLIITMAIAIHLIVRYRELFRRHPEASHRDLTLQTVALMRKPCLFAALTTAAGFASLVFSDIKPVITFGWMMITGIGVSMGVTFILFPSVLLLLPREPAPPSGRGRYSVAAGLARLTARHRTLILAVSLLALAGGIWGATRLRVENAFIDYFKESTEIHRGMKVIDRHLGGTTPLDVVVELEAAAAGPAEGGDDAVGPVGGAGQDAFAAFDEFDAAPQGDRYWFTADKMSRVMAIHDYLEGLPAIGKVLSLGTLLKIMRRINDDEPLDNFMLALMYSELPEDVRGILVDPYVSVADDQVRFSARIIDSQPGLRRNALLEQIRADLVERFGLAPSRVHLTGMMVLYNNMLQSLFQSQIMTLGATVLALMGMFLVLFRSVRIALVAIFPNLLSIGVVLGIMGWAGIPLDMMTITIAAISIGIAVDDTIHYVHRFRSEFATRGRYLETMHRCHDTIGHAMYYTSVTIITGFSILALSNFIPTIYFGLLTSLAMLIALVAALTLLPALIVMIRPFGPERPLTPAE